MKHRVAALSVAFYVTACGDDHTAMVDVAPEPAGDMCPYAGVRVTTDSGIAYVCNGADGTGASDITVTAEPAGSNCPDGGLRVTSSAGDAYVCNGGASAPVTVTSEPAGSNCEAGGIAVVTSTTAYYVCNGVTPERFVLADEMPGANCRDGGVRVTDASGSYFVCNAGASGVCVPSESRTYLGVEGIDPESIYGQETPANTIPALGYCYTLANDYDPQTGAIRTARPLPEPMRVFVLMDSRAVPLLLGDLVTGVRRTVRVQRFGPDETSFIVEVDRITLDQARLAGARIATRGALGSTAATLFELAFEYEHSVWERPQSSIVYERDVGSSGFAAPQLATDCSPYPENLERLKPVRFVSPTWGQITTSANAVCHSLTASGPTPITLIKPVDDATPFLLDAADRREILGDVTIDLVRNHPSFGPSVAQTYMRIQLEDAALVSIEQEPSELGLVERVGLVYRTITWSSPVTSVEVSASWENAD